MSHKGYHSKCLFLIKLLSLREIKCIQFMAVFWADSSTDL